MTAQGEPVTEGGGGVQPSRGKSGAERMREMRARQRAEKEAALRMSSSKVERAAAARQAGLPLPPMGDVVDGRDLVVAPGRPAGSVSRMTQQWRTMLLGRYQSPLIGMLEIANRPVHELAKELECSLLDAAKLQSAERANAAPYLHSRMPQAVQLDGAPIVPVVLGVTEARAVEIGVEPGGAFHIPRVLEHQEVRDDRDA